jgi:RNA polymerase sigma-70 factor (ECF subfamily)
VAVKSDEAEFSALFNRHRRELQAHCYRMVGSLDDAEDLVQETFARAWRARAGFRREGQWSFRAWLYRIATNLCLDHLARRPPRLLPADVAPAADPEIELPPVAGEVLWLDPYPDRLVDPHEAAVRRETLAIAFVAAIQHLTPRQRATLILRDVAGFSAKETAVLLEISVPAVNSSLQRARKRLRDQLPARRAEWSSSDDPSAQARAVAQLYIEALERGDFAALAEFVHADARFSFPPRALWYDGLGSFRRASDKHAAPGEHLLVPAAINLQPAFAVYLRAPGDSRHRPLALAVLQMEKGRVVEVIHWDRPELFEAFGLPMSFPAERRSNKNEVKAKEVP